MMKARIHGLIGPALFALSASLAVAIPAQAQDLPTETQEPAELFVVWKSVCYDHPGDIQAQIKVLTTSSIHAVEGKPEADGTRTFRGDGVLVWILDGPKTNYCAVAGNLTRATSDEEGLNLMQPLYGAPTEREEKRLFWTGDKGDHTFFAAYGYGQTRDGVPGALIGSGIERK